LRKTCAWAIAAVCVVLALGGCGDEGVAEDATVAVYVSAPLCAEAGEGLEAAGSRVGELELRAVCVDESAERGESRLAAIGAAARRATEDSSSIAYIGTSDPTSVRFSTPILEEAGIARLTTSSGKAAMHKLLRTLRSSDDPSSPRESLFEQLQ
jgi:hypothetical protein